MNSPYFFGCLAGVVLHELGHILAACALGVKVKRVGISWLGPYIVRERGTPNQDILIAFAGPLVNLLLASSTHGWFALSNAILGLYNLIPMRISDGGHIVSAVRRLRNPT